LRLSPGLILMLRCTSRRVAAAIRLRAADTAAFQLESKQKEGQGEFAGPRMEWRWERAEESGGGESDLAPESELATALCLELLECGPPLS
jgi:hypothetical protein